MSKKRFASVWDAIEDAPAQAQNMKLGSALIMALNGGRRELRAAWENYNRITRRGALRAQRKISFV